MTAAAMLIQRLRNGFYDVYQDVIHWAKTKTYNFSRSTNKTLYRFVPKFDMIMLFCTSSNSIKEKLFTSIPVRNLHWRHGIAFDKSQIFAQKSAWNKGWLGLLTYSCSYKFDLLLINVRTSMRHCNRNSVKTVNKINMSNMSINCIKCVTCEPFCRN